MISDVLWQHPTLESNRAADNGEQYRSLLTALQSSVGRGQAADMLICIAAQLREAKSCLVLSMSIIMCLQNMSCRNIAFVATTAEL